MGTVEICVENGYKQGKIFVSMVGGIIIEGG